MNTTTKWRSLATRLRRCWDWLRTPSHLDEIDARTAHPPSPERILHSFWMR